MPRTTIRDVAARAGVGIATVSRVLNQSPAVKAETRERILEAIRELDYRPHAAARRLSLGRSLTIGVVLPFLTRPSTVERLRGVQAGLAETEYDLVLYSVGTPEQRDQRFDRLSERARVDGVISISLCPTEAQLPRLAEAGVSLVLVDAFHRDAPHVIVDDLLGGQLATRHLLALGHRRIGFISDFLDNPFGFVSMKKRFLGYRKSLEEAGLPFVPRYRQEADHGRPEAAAMAGRLLAMPDRPSAIFAASDTQALGVLDAAERRDLRVPQDLSVVGYDDIELAAHTNLTTIRQPLFDSGVHGAKMLVSALGDRGVGRAGIEICVQTIELVERGTTAPPRGL